MPKRPTTAAQLPDTMPVFPLSGALLLPKTNRPLKIFEPRFVAMIDAIMGGDRMLALVQPAKNSTEESPSGDVALKSVACIGRLIHFEETDDDTYLIVLEGVCRADLGAEIETDAPFRRFALSAERFANDFDLKNGEPEVDRKRFVKIMRAYAEFADIEVDWEEVEQTGTAELVNLCCMLSPYGSAEKQMLLEAPDLAARAETLIALTEIEMMRAHAGITLQ